MARHDAAGKEMLGEPILLVVRIEAIGSSAVRENVNEERALRLQPSSSGAQQLSPVRHALEHFN